jgi:hypothetical protein
MLMRAPCTVALLTVSAALSAHHSTSLNFTDEIGTIEGQIVEVHWVNPHCSFVLEVTDEAGNTEQWLIEMLAKIALDRQGFDVEALKVGDLVTVSGRLGRRRSTMYLVEVVLPDGRTLKPPGPIR